MNNNPTYEDLAKKVKDLENSIETYRTLVDNTQDLLYRTDLDGRIIYVSPSVFRLPGLHTEAVLPQGSVRQGQKSAGDMNMNWLQYLNLRVLRESVV